MTRHLQATTKGTLRVNRGAVICPDTNEPWQRRQPIHYGTFQVNILRLLSVKKRQTKNESSADAKHKKKVHSIRLMDWLFAQAKYNSAPTVKLLRKSQKILCKQSIIVRFVGRTCERGNIEGKLTNYFVKESHKRMLKSEASNVMEITKRKYLWY